MTYLATVNNEYIFEQKQQLATQKQQLIETSVQLKQQQQELKNQHVLYEIFLEMQQQEHKLHSLLTKTEAFQKLEQKITQYEIYYKQFSVLLSQQTTKQRELNQLSVKLDNLQKKYVDADNQAKQSKTIVNQAQAEIEQLQKNRDNFQTNLSDIAVLSEIKAWIQNKQHLKNQEQQYKNSLLSLKQDINTLEQQKNTIISCHLQSYMQANWQGLNIQQLLKKLFELIDYFVKKADEIDQKFNNLSIKAELEQHAQNLHHGKPCPLCGSVEHPNPLQQTDIKLELQSCQHQKSEIQQHLVLLRQQQAHLQELATKMLMQQQYLQQNQQYYNDLQNHIVQHQQQFIWNDFKHVSDSEIEQQHQQVKKSQQQLSTLQKQLDAQLNILDKANITGSPAQNSV